MSTAHRPVLHGLLAFAAFLAVPAWAAPPAVVAQYHANDVVRLEASSKTAATKEERALAAGAALAFRGKDAEALATLTPVAHSKSPGDIRATAYLAMSDVYLRESRFAACYAAMASASKLSPTPLDSGTLQTMAFAHALSGVKPMRLAHQASGRLAITRDKAGLIEVPVKIDGRDVNAVADTGAGFSTISESAARQLGIRMLGRSASVASSASAALATKLGVAAQIRFGEAVLDNVVFIVLPDAALTFGQGVPNGPFKINAIIGLPVFIALGRIEIAHMGGKEDLIYGPKPGEGAGSDANDSNLLLSGVEPLVLVHVPQAAAPLRMIVDSGANATILNATVAKDVPALMAGATKSHLRLAGAGGMQTDQNAEELPQLTLVVAGRPFTLKKVSVSPKIAPDHDGVIGQDLLKQGSRVVIDFDAMHFAIKD